ncbi:MAG: maltose alpha-D-glucosyltransferase [Ardenticatenales bacterium]|nr:maltose alpha-D-glucosyltransferase [Ardenticatenales bacterium]
MLAGAGQVAARLSGQKEQWQRPYAHTQPAAAAARASVWFTAYPSAIMTQPGQTVLQALADPDLWAAFRDIGIAAVHTGPLKRSGGVTGRNYTPTIDGHFDRIGLEIDPQFGTDTDYRQMMAAANAAGLVVIGDIVPLHSGKGPDWRLAERAVDDYPGLYHMVEIAESDWDLLPDVPPGRDSVNLKPEVVDELARRQYIIGRLTRVIFYDPGVKESNWSATAPVRGADGVVRRWVYLHYFKEGQPVFNWLDQSFAAQRLIAGDIMHSLGVLGEGMVRLDANGFLGVERDEQGQVTSEGHPLAVTGNQLIAGLIRKAGGYSFQELNLTLDDMAAMGQGGADLSYDFVTRPAYHHALVTGNAAFLRLMLGLMGDFGIRANSLIHALQNHDELTLELVHFWTKYAEASFELDGETLPGLALREKIREQMYDRLMRAPHASYNLQSTTNGISCTTASIITATLGLADLNQIDETQKALIKQLHLLLVVYNAFQPGVFALSGWDLVGALPLPPAEVAELMADGDTRWIHRGGYDLLGKGGSADLPAAPSLYGPLTQQLADPDSFASQLKRLLALREQHQIYAAEQVGVLGAGGLLVMVHRLPASGAIQLTVINFCSEPSAQTITLPRPVQGDLQDMLTGEQIGVVGADNTVTLPLAGYSYKLVLVA